MALPAGFPPASFRLEVGCLMCSTTAAIGNWSARQDLHLRSPGPKPGMLLLHHALVAPVCWGNTGDFVSWGLRDPNTLNLCPAVRYENWRTRRELHPGGRAQAPSRRQRVAPLIELRVQNGCRAEAAVTALA